MPDVPPSDELARLRERAYGPDADIANDPAALARLRALEAGLPSTVGNGSRDPAPEAGDGDAAEPLADGATGGSGHDAAGHGGSPAGAADAPTSGEQAPRAVSADGGRGRRALRIAGWAASVAAAAVAASLVTWWVSAPHPDDVLTIDVGAEIPATAEDAFQGEIVRFSTWHGLVLLAGASEFNRAEQYECLGMMYAQDGGTADILTTGACAPAGLDPVLDLVVDGVDLPVAFTEALPDATAVRFVRRGTVVEVYVVEEAGAPQSGGEGA